MTQAEEDPTERVRGLLEQQRSAKLRALGREQLGQADLQNVRAELQDVSAQLDSIVRSRSWKLTQTLRDASAWARSFLGAGNTREATQTPGPIAIDEQPAATHGPAAGVDGSFSTQGRDAWDRTGFEHLSALLQGEARLVFPQAERCEISIIVVLYNKAHLGLLCLESILQNADVSYQLIVVDNNSTDNTRELLERLHGAEIIGNEDNLGFGRACVQGAERARGEYLCFLNNDARLGPGSLGAVFTDCREDKSIGAIGGKVLLADGLLQEAGAMVWKDGSTWGYGRGDNPALPRYQFRRPVDYCSAVFLFTPRKVFNEVGGFDDRFSPAYYEDTDYCFKIWDKGLRVIYEPQAVIHHYESGSSETTEAVKAAISNNRAKFVGKWGQQLEKHLPLAGEHVPYARIAQQAGSARILYLDAPASKGAQTSESTRCDSVVAKLTEHGNHVTMAWTCRPAAAIPSAGAPKDIEYVDVATAAHYVFRELLSQYDAVWIKGPQSMRTFLLHIRNMDGRIPPIIYDVGPITAQGEAMETREPVTAAESASRLNQNLAFGDAADIVVVAAEEDRQFLLAKGVKNVRVLSAKNIAEVMAEIRTGVGKPPQLP